MDSLKSGNERGVVACGLDLGSNSFRLLIARVNGKEMEPLAMRLETVRLGEGLDLSGLLSVAAMERGSAVLARFAEDIAAHRPYSLRMCGTHALRQADNGAAFQKKAQEIIGTELEILSGEDEARLTMRGACYGLAEAMRFPMLLVDVGGGSTELIFLSGKDDAGQVLSLPLGAVNMSERFASAGRVDHTAMASHLQKAFAAERDFFTAAGNSLLVGSGGTTTSLAALDLGLDTYDSGKVQNYSLSRETLAALYDRLQAMTSKERNALAGLGQGRGDIIVAGAVIYLEILARMGARAMLVSDAALLEGILFSGLAQRETERRKRV